MPGITTNWVTRTSLNIRDASSDVLINFEIITGSRTKIKRRWRLSDILASGWCCNLWTRREEREQKKIISPNKHFKILYIYFWVHALGAAGAFPNKSISCINSFFRSSLYRRKIFEQKTTLSLSIYGVIRRARSGARPVFQIKRHRFDVSPKANSLLHTYAAAPPREYINILHKGCLRGVY